MSKHKTKWKLPDTERVLPKEIFPENTCLTLTGQRDLVIENYKGILEYSSEKLVLLAPCCKVEILGKHLQILYYAREEMKVSGQIQCISYK